MPNKLTIVFSGRRGAGKSSAANFVLSEYLNLKIGKKRFNISKIGKEVFMIDSFNKDQIIPVEYPNPQIDQLISTYSVKVYSFEDPVKKFCIDNLGLDTVQCYGTEDDRNSSTHISWEDLFDQVREKYSRPRRGSGGMKPASGFMTAKEVMQVMEHDVFRRVDSNCWARALYSLIDSEGYDLAIVTNASYPNEITLGTENGSKSIRLLRHVDKGMVDDAMENFPLGEYSLVVDNHDLSMTDTHNKIRPHIHNWFKDRKVV